MRPPQTPPDLKEPHLANSTVWSQARTRTQPHLGEWFNRAVRGELILTCAVVALELMRSAPSAASFTEQAELLGLLRSCPLDALTVSRAREVQALLARRAQHRGVPPADLLIAASAEQAGVPLLHYDRDYERIAAVTGQPTRWLAPAGSLP